MASIPTSLLGAARVSAGDLLMTGYATVVAPNQAVRGPPGSQQRLNPVTRALRIAVAVAGSLIHVICHAAEPLTVFGVKLGEPLPPTILVCHPLHRSGTERAACHVPPARDDRPGRYKLGMDQAPDWVPSFEMSYTLIDGNVEAVTILTSGISQQSKVLEALREKYGEPTLLREKSVQNMQGAAFAAIEASWDGPNYHVEYGSAVGRLDQGAIVVQTEKGREAAMSVRAIRRAQEPKM